MEFEAKKEITMKKKKASIFITTDKNRAAIAIEKIPSHRKRPPKPCCKCGMRPVQLLFDNEVYCPNCHQHIVDKSLPAAIVAWNMAN